MSVDVIRSAALAGVPHGFLGRVGGVSAGHYAGLNVGLGSDDEPAHVAENRRRALAAVVPGGRLVTLYQVHSADCVTVEAPFDEALRPRADALVTDRPELALGILTADCAPVLFADAEVGVVGAAHAGWQGALAGITDTTLVAMEALGARRERVAAAIGPCIAQPSYEVDGAFRRRFEAADSENAAFFAPGADGRHQFDLEGYVASRLAAAGIGRVDRIGQDTYSDPARFFSYRRATHRGEPSYGRQISIVGVG